PPDPVDRLTVVHRDSPRVSRPESCVTSSRPWTSPPKGPTVQRCWHYMHLLGGPSARSRDAGHVDPGPPSPTRGKGDRQFPPVPKSRRTAMLATPKIARCLWFDDRAEEAAHFYVGIFKNSKILDVSRYSEAGYEVHGRPAGSVMTVGFELDGQRF